MNRSEYDANIHMESRAKAARMGTAYIDDEDPIGVFRGLFVGLLFTFVVAALVVAIVTVLP